MRNSSFVWKFAKRACAALMLAGFTVAVVGCAEKTSGTNTGTCPAGCQKPCCAKKGQTTPCPAAKMAQPAQPAAQQAQPAQPAHPAAQQAQPAQPAHPAAQQAQPAQPGQEKK